MPRILVWNYIHQDGIDILVRNSFRVTYDIHLSEADLRKEISQYDAIILKSGKNLDKAMLEVAQGNLRIIGLAQIGKDNIDKAVESLGITVVNSPKANVIPTANLTLGLILGKTRHIVAAQQVMLEGKWEPRNNELIGVEVSGKTLGIIGLGKIGFEVAKRAIALQMNVIAYNRFSENSAASGNAEKMRQLIELLYQGEEEKPSFTFFQREEDLAKLLSDSDIITLHIDKKGNVDLINRDKIAKMKRTALIINCARGGIVNETDLLEALKNNRIEGAALDVFETEPLPPDSPLREFAKTSNKLILTPHLGSGTKEAQRAVAVDVAEQICDFFKNNQ